MAKPTNGQTQAEQGDTYKVTVDYSKSLTEMIRAGRYAWVDGDITPEHFPHDRTRALVEVEMRLLHLGRDAMTSEVLEKHERQGMRPANLPELLALGANHPDLQRKLWIVALSFGWRDSFNHAFVSVLGRDDVGRYLRLFLDAPAVPWHSASRFLAVRK